MPFKGVFMWHGKCGSIHFTRIDFKFDSFTLWLLLFTVRFRNKLKICFFSSSWCCNKWWCIKIVLFLFQVAKKKPALIDKSVEKVRKTRFWYTFEYYFRFLYKPSHIFSVWRCTKWDIIYTSKWSLDDKYTLYWCMHASASKHRGLCDARCKCFDFYCIPFDKLSI